MRENTSGHPEENGEFSEDDLNYYMELRRRRMQKQKKHRKRIGLAAAAFFILLGMGISFEIAWRRAGETTFETDTEPGASVATSGSGLAGQSDTAQVAEEAEERTEDQTPSETAADESDAADEGDTADESDAVDEIVIAKDGDETFSSASMAEARHYAAQYDYEKALSVLRADPDYDSSQSMQTLAGEIREEMDSCQVWTPEEVLHIFYHTLVRDPSLAFDGDSREAGYNQYMTTIREFNQITQSMYDKGYVMVSIYDLAEVDENGNMVPGEILLPPGKKPFVLSQDDVCYYHYMDGDGMAANLIVDEEGKIRNTYIETDGSVSTGDYDMVPLIDRFVEEHPDFSYRGAKGIIALTGYNGILGYRTDISYETRPEDMDDAKRSWLDAHPDFDLETERAKAKQVVDAMKAEGWLFASHTWGHLNIGEVSLERLVADTERFQENVDPLIGGTDIIIFAFGTDLSNSSEYSGEKYEYLYGRGYRYYCNVDATEIFVQLTDDYLRMSRKNLDGYRMYYNPELLSDLYDPSEVFDPSRPVPVPPMS